MAMWDPEAAGNAAQYLRLGDMELLDVRNAPFEGKIISQAFCIMLNHNSV